MIKIKKEQITRYYYIITSIIFLFIGMLFQSNMLGRKVIFLLYPSLSLISVLFVVFDKTIKEKKNIFWDIRDVLLIIAMASYWYCIYTKGYYPGDNPDLHDCIMRATISISVFIFGKFFIMYDKNNNGKNAINIVIPFGIGLMIFNIISIYSAYHYYYNRVINNISINRSWLSIMFPTWVMNATIYSYYPLILISLLTHSVIFFKKKILLNSLIIVSGVASAIWFWVETKTRTPIVVLIITITLGLLLVVIDKFSEKKEINIKKTSKILIGIVVGLICIYISFRMFVINSEWYESCINILSRDGGIINNVRVRWSLHAIHDLYKYPFGGNHTVYREGYTTTHLSWTDIAYCGGIIPFFAIMIWLMLIFKDIIKLSFSSNAELYQKMILLLPFFAVFLYSCTEALRIMNYPLCSVFLFAGMIRGQFILNRGKIKREY